MSDRGEFVLDPRGTPKRYVREHGRVIVAEIAPRPQDDEDVIDELMAGVSNYDIQGPPSGFGRHFASAGAGPIDARPKRHDSYDNSDQMNTSVDQLEDEIGDEGDADLFGQPNKRPRREMGDFIQASGKSSDDLDQDDIWDTSNYDDFTDDENGASGPITEHPPHKKTSSLDTLLDDIFDE